MRIAFITSGAAGMFCGSCMRDNTLVTALQSLGHDALLIPTFTPIRTDELDVSTGQVFYGGINVFMQQKSWLFRKAPRFVDWLLNRPALLRFVTRRAVNTSYENLADLTLSMLHGTDGHQVKELEKLVEWLKTEVKPDVVMLTNVLLSGLVPKLKSTLNVPVIATLQGDDVFLDALPAEARRLCLEAIRKNDRSIDGYIATSRDYADHIATYLGIDREKIRVVYPGLNIKGHRGPRTERPSGPPVIGYFSRICPEKGLHALIHAFIHLRKRPGAPVVKLKIAGWLGDHHKAYLAEQIQKLTGAGLIDDFEHIDCPTHTDKVRFLQSLDVFCVPATFREPKGLYVLEAWANGVPVVQPKFGAFPELIEATGGGLITESHDPHHLADALLQILTDMELRDSLGKKGWTGLNDFFTARTMAEETVAVLRKYVGPTPDRKLAASVS